MTLNNLQNTTSPTDNYMRLKAQQCLVQTQHQKKTQSRNNAIFQGILALSGIALGHYSLTKNNPFAFLLCLAITKGAIEQHTKALSQYFNSARILKNSEKN